MRRLAAWYVTGPLGHLVAGVADLGGAFVRWRWSLLRARLFGR
jgi:hypothetical protein